jgi:guanylate kinase
LFGKSASGKDTIQNWIVSNFPQFTHKIVSCTTRPKRENEKEGFDYFFLTDEEFTKKVLDGSMLEATSFRDWFYGTALDQLDPEKINVGVFNPSGVECLLEDSRLEVVPVLIYANGKVRLFRSLNRENSPNCREICRRYLADEKDFEEVEFEYDGWINETDEHSTWRYRIEQLSRILTSCSWADFNDL